VPTPAEDLQFYIQNVSALADISSAVSTGELDRADIDIDR
jgi:hypothetical protein